MRERPSTTAATRATTPVTMPAIAPPERLPLLEESGWLEGAGVAVTVGVVVGIAMDMKGMPDVDEPSAGMGSPGSSM